MESPVSSKRVSTDLLLTSATTPIGRMLDGNANSEIQSIKCWILCVYAAELSFSKGPSLSSWINTS